MNNTTHPRRSQMGRHQKRRSNQLIGSSALIGHESMKLMASPWNQRLFHWIPLGQWLGTDSGRRNWNCSEMSRSPLRQLHKAAKNIRSEGRPITGVRLWLVARFHDDDDDDDDDDDYHCYCYDINHDDGTVWNLDSSLYWRWLDRCKYPYYGYYYCV